LHAAFGIAQDSAIIRRIVEFGGEDRRSRFAAAMRIEQRRKSFGAKERRIARYDKHNLRASADRAPCDLHGVASAALRLLQNGLRSKLGDDGANFLRLMSYDNKQLRWFEWQASAHDVLDKRASPGAMQDFRQIGTHARAFAGS
jgi:hypothetical protein